MKSLPTVLALSVAVLLMACAGPMGSMRGPMAGSHRHHPDSAPAMQEHMAHMQAMRDRMNRAQSPEERHSLMDEHMKAMHNGMASLKSMGGPHGPTGSPMDLSQRQDKMQAQMDMMQTMMDMMLQRLPR